MGIKISVWAAAGVAFVISFAGTALFFVAARQLKQAAAKESGSESDTETKKDQDPYQYPYKNTAKWWQAGMYVGNVAAVAALTVVCQEDLFTVLKMLCLCTVLWVCAWTDCKAYLIFNQVLLFGLAVFLVLFALQCVLAPENIRYAAIEAGIAAGGVFTAGLLCRMVMPGSVGFGDLKLLFFMGLYLGMHIWNAIFYTLLASFAVSVYLLVTKRATRKTALPFAPFLLAGTLSALCLQGR